MFGPRVLAVLCLVSTSVPARNLVVLEMTGALEPEVRARLSDEIRGAAAEVIGETHRVLTRESMDTVLTGMGTAPCESECEVTTMRQLGADHGISGDVVRIAGMYVVTMKLFDVRTGALLGMRSVRAPELLALMDAMRPNAVALLHALQRAPSTEYRHIRVERRAIVLVSRPRFFSKGSTVLTPEARPVLDEVAAAILEQRCAKVMVHVHTDGMGFDAFLDVLTRQRAAAVIAYLVSKGVAPAVLEGVGHGARQRVASDFTAAGRERNRRVEFEIISPG